MTAEERQRFHQMLNQGADPRYVWLLIQKTLTQHKIAFAQDQGAQNPMWSKTLEIEQGKLNLIDYALQRWQQQGVA